jgi:hypothetical protein
VIGNCIKGKELILSAKISGISISENLPAGRQVCEKKRKEISRRVSQMNTQRHAEKRLSRLSFGFLT